MKKESRFFALNEGSFRKGEDREVLLVGAITLGGGQLEGVLSGKAEVDGDNATDQLISMIMGSKFQRQLKVIFLGGLSVGGFNVIDIHRLSEETGIPVMVVIRRYPDLRKIESTLEKIDMLHKFALFERAGPILYQPTEEFYYQVVGLSTEEIKEIIRLTCTTSNLPEPLRLARMISAGISKGES